MVTQEQLHSAERMMKKARRVLKKFNFIRAKRLAQLMHIGSQRASDILGALPEWRIYSRGNGALWAREGYPQ